jgi:hypothetical protein
MLFSAFDLEAVARTPADGQQESFVAEARDVLRTGLAMTGLPWFATRTSNSRLNFLDLRRAGHADCVLNDAIYGYMRKHSLSPADRQPGTTAERPLQSASLAGASRPAQLHRVGHHTQPNAQLADQLLNGAQPALESTIASVYKEKPLYDGGPVIKLLLKRG